MSKPEYAVGATVTLAGEQHPSVKPVGDAKVTATHFDKRQKCWMHTVHFSCDKRPNSFPAAWLKLAEGQAQ